MKLVSRIEAAYLFVLTAIPFLFYIFKPDIFGSDGYAYLLWICQQSPLQNQGMIAEFIFNVMPCNIIAVKCVLFLLCFVSVLAIANLGKLFWKNGWFAGVLALLSPAMIFEFFKFENDQFALPLIFWSVYFFYVGLTHEQEETRMRSTLISAGLLVIAGLIWEASAFMIFAFALANFFFTFLAVPVFFMAFPKFDQALGFVHWGKVAENTPLIGLIWLGFLLLGFTGLIRGNKAGWRFVTPAILLFLVVMLNAKYVLLVVPFLAVGMINAWNTIIPKEFKTMLFAVILFLPFLYGFQSLGMQPTETDWKAIDFALNEAHYEKIQNDWDLGWWVKWHGGETNNFAGPNSQFKEPSGIVLSRLEQVDCPLLKAFEHIGVYDCR